MEDENGTPTSTETTETTETTDTTEVTETTEAPEEETPEELKARLAKAEELAQNYKRRAEKAEQKAKNPVPVVTEGDLSTKDVLSLVNAKISADDYDEVVRMSKLLGKSVGDTLADNSVKAILSAREEERRTAQATQTRSPRGTTKSSGDDLLRKAEKTGEIPDSDDALQEMQRARLARRKAG